MSRRRWRWAVLVPVVVASLCISDATALPFGASVDRFEGDGNVYGSADGVFDLVDEFDDGALAPAWAPLLGTVVESGGVLTARDPGVVLAFLGLPQELSTAESTAELEDGAGDFTVVSHWVPAPLGVNTQFFFHLYGSSPAIESSGMTVNNFDAATAAAQGAPVGWSIGRQRVFPLGGEEPDVVDFVAIDPLAITGGIVLRMSFDDATNLLTSSFSLDGGATFEGPFSPLGAFVHSPDGEILLGAAAITSSPPPPPPPAPCSVHIAPVRVKFQKLSLPSGEQGFRMSGRVLTGAGVPPVLDPVAQGVLLGAGSGLGPTTGYDVPAGALGMGGCGPEDGWKLAGRTWTYTNRSGARPPFCEPGTANGLRKVRIRDDRARRGSIRVGIVARDAIVPIDPMPVPAHAVVWVGGLDPGGEPVLCATEPLTCVAKGYGITCD